ncbi:efflux transporter outer membrane subunit [Comamonas serinivorans]|uniref:efflux transporter outer membrane subunit n=1 Tax=Comamonas serinivorans TaxID=1082851 RepID=UPI001EFFACED|nr:efflux transporter outer membrane subunit [Comamonas serinivorans]
MPDPLFIRGARWAAPVLLLAGLCACSLTPPPAQVATAVPARWHLDDATPPSPAAPGQPAAAPVASLHDAWQQLNDPVLLQLIAQALAVSPDVASARTRVSEARAGLIAAGAARLPTLDGQLSATRSNAGTTTAQGGTVPATVLQAGLQSQWEIDLFGGRGAAHEAASRRAEAALAQQAAAHVALAAEVANAYFNERACSQQWDVARADAESRAHSAQLTALSAQAGFTAPADAALARAAAADAAARTRDTQTQCAVARKALVALTASDEAALAQQLQDVRLREAWPVMAAVPSVPAPLLLQRPDVFAAEQAVAAASADVGEAQAQRYPRLTLTGSIGRMQTRALGVHASADTWSLGPLALSVPLFDGGVRRANVATSQARYDEAVVGLRATVRDAVREVEVALTQLAASQARKTQLQTAVADYQRYLRATQARHDNGLASQFELEDARRTWLAARLSLVGVQRDEALAWVSLYRALGGGWQRDGQALADAASATPASPASPTTASP